MSVLPAFEAPPDGALTPAMRAAYERAGVVILRGFETRETCAALKARVDALIDGFDAGSHAHVFSTTTQAHAKDHYFLSSGDRIAFFLEDEAIGPDGRLTAPKRWSVNKIGHALHDLDPAFSAVSRSPKMRALAASLGFRDPKLLQSMLISKPPGVGGEVACHQDSTFLYTEPETCVGFWFALDPATLENGCMRFIPGEHKGSLRRRFRRTGEGTETEMAVLDASPFDEARALPAVAGVGDLVVFHGRAPHLSGANRSARPREAYTLHVIDGEAGYPADNWLRRSPAMPLRGF